jgi:putative DNA primase/helicase
MTGDIAPFVALTQADTSFPFCDAALDALVKLIREDPRVWQQLRAALKAAKVQIKALNDLIDERGKAARGTSGAGKTIMSAEIEPWPESVDGVELLTGISAALRRYMVMSEAHSDATALWAVHTWSHDFRDTSPLLIVTSPVPGCAKTRLLDTVSRVVLHPLSASGITSASLVNVIDKYLPTLLVDEYDAQMHGERERAEAIRGAVNAAHMRSGAVLVKNVPTSDGWVPRPFSVWAPIALAGIGKPQRTLLERGLVITLQKKLRKDVIARLRMKDGDDLRQLAPKAARWVADNEERLREVEPAMPEAFGDRDCDKWDPLIAIADVAGGVDIAGSTDLAEDEWPSRARRVAVELTKADAEDVLAQDVKLLLLADIRDIFASLYPPESTAYQIGRGPRISTERLLKGLYEIEERDWATFGRVRKPLTDVGLSRLLSGYEIRPNRVRVNADGILSIPASDMLSEVSEEALGNANKAVRRGYYLTSFAEAFERYL